MNVDVVLVLVNVLLCGWRFLVALQARRLASIPWALMTYFAIFFLPVAQLLELSWYRGFTAEAVTATHDVIHRSILYVLAFNSVFALADAVVAPLFVRRAPMTAPAPEFDGSRWQILRAVLLGFWVVGGALYVWKMRSSGYRDYVEGSSWALVFFWAASPLIVLHAMKRQWWWACVLCLPFLYFAVQLNVRSFALLSVVPMVVVGLLRAGERYDARNRLWRMLGYAALGGISLLLVSLYLGRYKSTEIVLPDSGMPFGFVQTTAMVDRYDKHVGFAGLQLYGWNYINPFMRLFAIERPRIVDTPVVIAGLLEGVPEDWPVYFHYPTLIWADAYISFGWTGLWLAALWAVVLCAWEWAMTRNPRMLSLLLPFFCWHCYMLIRGAIAVASVPMAYAFYLVLIVYLMSFGASVLRRDFPGRPAALEPSSTTTRFANLMT